MRARGFTLVELLVTISIISVLGAIVLTSLNSAKDSAYYGRAKLEFRNIATALELYKDSNGGQYPADAARDVAPTGLSQYIAGYSGSDWPKGPWPGSFYDWDNWTISGEKVYQISIRFCPAGGNLSTCRFPKASWASSFDIDSSVYYCISGSCRAHESQPVTYPGLCVNC
ncbi:MAG: type II secretion system protein [Candidatus Paceibacterota bacterium]